jgi:hypothetical protein
MELILKVPLSEEEFFNEETHEFEDGETFTLELMHSLASLSKWESKFEKPFLTSVEKTFEETMYYIEAMTLTPNVPPEIYLKLSAQNMLDIKNYIDAKMTATWFKAEESKRPSETITAEIIYYWMISLNIDLEWENRHLSRLMTLVQVINEKNKPPQKLSPRAAAAQQRKLNAERQKQLGTKG